MIMKFPIITGNICSGKSYCGRIISSFGYSVIDADEIVKKGLEKGEYLYSSYVGLLGQGILKQDGILDKKAVRDLIFSSKAVKKQIEDIAHPYVLNIIAEEYRILRKRCNRIICINPLYYEMLDSVYHGPVILVYCRDEVRIKRLMERDQVDSSTALRIIKNQFSQREKVFFSDYIIDNSFDEEFTAEQAGLLMWYMES